MNDRTNLNRLDAVVDAELVESPRPMPSRASGLLEVEARHAQDEAERANHEATHRKLNRQTIVLGQIGTQVGREVEVLISADGRTVLLRDLGQSLRHGLLCALSAAQAGRLVELLGEALLGVNTVPSGEVGRVGPIVVERTAIGVVIRDAAVPHHGGVLVQVNADQAARLLDGLRRGLPREDQS